MWFIENNKLYYKDNTVLIFGASYSNVNDLTNETNVKPRIKVSMNGLYCCVYFEKFEYAEIYEYNNFSVKFLFATKQNNIHTFEFIYEPKINRDAFIINNNKYTYFGVPIDL